MLYRCSFHPGSARWATATVELALLTPFLCTALVAATDLARVYYCSITVSNCARNGALYGSSDQAHALDQNGIISAAQMDASDLTLSLMQVTSTTDSTTQPTYVVVTITYPFTMLVPYPGLPSQITVTRSVRMSVTPPSPTFS